MYGNWQFVQNLGEGAFGVVQHWKNVVTDQEIATKSLKKELNLRREEFEVLKRRWLQEHKWMSSANIEHIVQSVELNDTAFLQYLQNNHHWRDLPVLVLDYCNGGDLRSLLNRPENVNGLIEHDVRDILLALRSAIEFLHFHCDIEHRDIKPENILIHNTKGERIYKLTDFGYARQIPEHTIDQSIVGTRHYVAPEVIDPGSYNKTVDYWSMGIVAEEIITGRRPFLPHKNFIEILTTIKKKPEGCIAITEDLSNTLSWDTKICEPHRCSPLFIEQIEQWLALALDGNYKTRGKRQDVLVFYSMLDDILASKILTVFSLSNQKFYYYDVKSFPLLQDFYTQLSKDTGIKHFSLVLPTNHPKRNRIEQVEDFFVREWTDSNNSVNPPVMLYVADPTQCDCNVNMTQISIMCPSWDYLCRMPDLKLSPAGVDRIERELHNLLSAQHRQWLCYCNGLYELTITRDDRACRYETKKGDIFKSIQRQIGQMQQFMATAENLKKNTGAESFSQVQKYADRIKIHDEIYAKISNIYYLLRKLGKELCSNKIFKNVLSDDIFQLQRFRNSLEVQRTLEERVDSCFSGFDECNNQLMKMSKNPEIKKMQKDVYIHFKVLNDFEGILYQTDQDLREWQQQLDNDTRDMCLRICENRIVGPNLNASQLITDAHNLMSEIISIMDIEGCNNKTSISTSDCITWNGHNNDKRNV